ncbi:MAG TPA: hypothetical protein DCM68_02060 [Verrucomicrobia bacterium]|nr:hypothetical protein [Verrucomicrobiota bacterium]
MGELRSIAVIAKGVWLEAVRRKDVYVLVLLCCGLIGLTMTVDFFDIEGLTKFYREIALKLMDVSTAAAVILLACRQLPREFEQRTIYPLLARPIGRLTFLLGKMAGVCAAAAFCFGLFMAIFAAGIASLGGGIGWSLFLQHAYLQMLQMLLLTTACFALSLACSPDAALTLAFLFYFTAGLLGDLSVMLYEVAGTAGRAGLWLLTYVLPQLALFDLSEKTVHFEIWPALGPGTMAALTAYALVYSLALLGLAHALFRRRPL